MRHIVKSALDKLVIAPARRVPVARRIGTYIARALSEDGYHELRERFIANGRRSPWSESVRADLVARFETIDRQIPIASTPSEGLHLAEALLSLDAEGDVMECGCFAGGSTAKLSLIAKLRGRTLHVFDSFEGLPEVDEANRKDFNARMGSDWVTAWEAGRYAARLECVKSNVERFGEIDQCRFHKGWFEETLASGRVPERIAMVFVDVDIPSSARECLAAIWPRLSERGVYFQHDVGFIKLLQMVLDEELWTRDFKEFPPVLFGAGYGLGDDSPYLGYFVKGRSATADYINQLTVKK